MMMKTIRVNHVPFGAPEGLALLVYARSLDSAVKKLRRQPHMGLPNGVYYVYEAGRYARGRLLTIHTV